MVFFKMRLIIIIVVICIKIIKRAFNINMLEYEIIFFIAIQFHVMSHAMTVRIIRIIVIIYLSYVADHYIVTYCQELSNFFTAFKIWYF